MRESQNKQIDQKDYKYIVRKNNHPSVYPFGMFHVSKITGYDSIGRKMTEVIANFVHESDAQLFAMSKNVMEMWNDKEIKNLYK